MNGCAEQSAMKGSASAYQNRYHRGRLDIPVVQLTDGVPNNAPRRQKKASIASDQWQCAMCTMVNHVHLAYCEVCGTQRPSPKKAPSLRSPKQSARNQQRQEKEHEIQRLKQQFAVNQLQIQQLMQMNKHINEKLNALQIKTQPSLATSMMMLGDLQLDENDYDSNEYRDDYKEEVNFECQVCLGTKSLEDRHTLCACKHTFCRGCLRSHITHYPKPELPDCPLPNCRVKMSDHGDVQVLVTQTEYYRLHEKINKIGMSALANLKHCLTPNCKFAVELEGGTRLHCPLCGNVWCTECQVRWHQKITCAQYKEHLRQQKIQTEAQKRDMEFNGWVGQQHGGVRRCPNCRKYVQKNGGCDHMTCRCGTHWNWSTGQPMNM